MEWLVWFCCDMKTRLCLADDRAFDLQRGGASRAKLSLWSIFVPSPPKLHPQKSIAYTHSINIRIQRFPLIDSIPKFFHPFLAKSGKHIKSLRDPTDEVSAAA